MPQRRRMGASKSQKRPKHHAIRPQTQRLQPRLTMRRPLLQDLHRHRPRPRRPLPPLQQTVLPQTPFRRRPLLLDPNAPRRAPPELRPSTHANRSHEAKSMGGAKEKGRRETALFIQENRRFPRPRQILFQRRILRPSRTQRPQTRRQRRSFYPRRETHIPPRRSLGRYHKSQIPHGEILLQQRVDCRARVGYGGEGAAGAECEQSGWR